MHVRIRFNPKTMRAQLTMVVGPLGFEDSSPTLENVWENLQATRLDDALSRSLFIMRVNNPVLPRVIVEWPDCGFHYALQVNDGIAQWVWASNDPKKAPPGTQIYNHHFVGGKGYVVPVTKKTLHVIESFAAVYAAPLGYHYLPFQSHGHCVINLWLRFGFHSDSPDERDHMTLTACDSVAVTDVFKKVCGRKAEAERFCLMPLNWVDGVLVRGSPISYRTANSKKSTIDKMGWGEEVWLWPCAPQDNLVSFDGVWKEEDLVGFPFIDKAREKGLKSIAKAANKEALSEMKVNKMQMETNNAFEANEESMGKTSIIAAGGTSALGCEKIDLFGGENSISNEIGEKRMVPSCMGISGEVSTRAIIGTTGGACESAEDANCFFGKMDEKMVPGRIEMMRDVSAK